MYQPGLCHLASKQQRIKSTGTVKYKKFQGQKMSSSEMTARDKQFQVLLRLPEEGVEGIEMAGKIWYSARWPSEIRERL